MAWLIYGLLETISSGKNNVNGGSVDHFMYLEQYLFLE